MKHGALATSSMRQLALNLNPDPSSHNFPDEEGYVMIVVGRHLAIKWRPWPGLRLEAAESSNIPQE